MRFSLGHWPPHVRQSPRSHSGVPHSGVPHGSVPYGGGVPHSGVPHGSVPYGGGVPHRVTHGVPTTFCVPHRVTRVPTTFYVPIAPVYMVILWDRTPNILMAETEPQIS